ASSRDAVLEAGRRAHLAGATVIDGDLPAPMVGLADLHPIVHAFEAARSLAWELDTHADELSASLREILGWGARIDAQTYDDARHRWTPAPGDAEEPAGLPRRYEGCGDGPLDVVFISEWTTHVEWQGEHPPLARFLERLASFSRVIVFDKRGMGLSDPLPLDS